MIRLKRLFEEFFPQRDAFDARMGTNTSGMVSLIRLRVRSENKAAGVHYKGIDPERFNRAMSYVSKDKTFIDLGCGKGRALILARLAGFSKLIGVEFSSALARTASENLAKLHIDATILEMDATAFALPSEPCVVFMYNPFRPPVFNRVVERLAAHGNISVLYANPEHKSVIEETGKFMTVVNEAGLFIAQSVTA